jgi:GNAT superfamily N-acetyltransferase
MSNVDSSSVLYSAEPDLSAEEFRDVLVASTLSARRPVHDRARLDAMLRHADLVVTAREAGRLVGVARSVTDYSYCCYLSDLAVDATRQKLGIGKRLIEETRLRAGPRTTLILVAAPGAESYYPHIGLQPHPSCWIVPRSE